MIFTFQNQPTIMMVVGVVKGALQENESRLDNPSGFLFILSRLERKFSIERGHNRWR